MLRRQIILTLIFLASLLALSACIYHPPVQQGTILSDRLVSKVQRGMSRRQVEKILGDPVLMDSYPSNRLTYIYTLQPSRHHLQERQLLIYFRSGSVVNYNVRSTANLKPPQ